MPNLGVSKLGNSRLLEWKSLEVTYDIWLTLANFPVNDMPMIYRSGYRLFCPVSIPPSHGNIYYRFLWEATLPPSYPCVSWGWIHRNGSSWGGHTAPLIRAQHPPKHSNETKPKQGLKSDRWDLSQIFIGSRGKKSLFLSIGFAKALGGKQMEAGWHKKC